MEHVVRRAVIAEAVEKAPQVQFVAKHLIQDRKLTQNVVYYFLVDADNQLLVKSGYGAGYGYGNGMSSACFASIFHTIPETAVACYVWHPADSMGYGEEEIRHWIADISELGFECEYMGEWDNKAFFRIDIAKMETKNQFCSTLTLIRCLYEQGSARIPDLYFQALEENPNMDKFEALQNAHKHPSHQWLGLGHNVTSKDNGLPNITLDVLFERFRKEKKTPFSNGYTTLNKCWAGEGSPYLKEYA